MNLSVRQVFFFIFLVFLLSVIPVSAAPKTYKTGIYINRIKSYDTKIGLAEIDLWYWVVAEGEAPSLKNLELSNGSLKPLGKPVTMQHNGRFYASMRYIASAAAVVDMSRFPFDKQIVTLSFEDGDSIAEDLIFVPDTGNSGIDRNFKMNDWEIGKLALKTGNHYYSSSFGDLDLPSGQGSNYSQFLIELELIRRGSFWQKIFKYFWAVIVSVIVGLFALLIRVCDLDARFGMAVGALFANVGCSFLLSDLLPKSTIVSLAEMISFISLGFIMIFLVESIISLNFYNRGRVKVSRYMDWAVFGICSASYAVMWPVMI